LVLGWRTEILGWVAAVDFRKGGDSCAAQPWRNFGKLEKLHNGVVIGAVADSAGSAASSHLGAKVSVRSGLSALRADVDVLSTALTGGSQSPLEDLFAKVMEAVGEAVQRAAVEENIAASELATSLTVFFVDPFGLAAMQVGRTLLVYRARGGAYGLVFELADMSNDCDYVTGPDAIDCMRTGFTRGPIEFLCLASSAFEPVSLEENEGIPVEPFFQPLDRYASSALDDGDVHRGIREFLRTSGVSREIGEDLTLALCRYNPGDNSGLGLG
jgi:hypothetical protein